MTVKVTSIKTDFRGIRLPDAPHQGRGFERALSNAGNPVNNGHGPDYPEVGLEVKTKDIESTSANTVGTILYEDIKVTPYGMSSICKKLQQQFRVTVKDNIIVDQYVYDFSAPHIQEVIAKAYETARAKIIAGDKSSYISGTGYGFFEQKRLKGGTLTNSWAFRIPVKSMKKLEGMAQSTYANLFE
jgi:hypothetical protein